MFFIKEPFKNAWQDKDIFYEAKDLCERAEEDQIYRNKEGRLTLRFYFKNESYFLKYHGGVGWKEIFKNLFQLRAPVLGARNEYEAAKALQALGVDTLTPVVYGARGLNPATQESFLITEDLTNTTSLEDYCWDWPKQPPNTKIKQALIKKVAQAAKAMHSSGMNHRDFYICHFLLKNGSEGQMEAGKGFSCYLIDLHRCQIRGSVPRRWLVKDLGGLLYSTMAIGLKPRDYYCFICFYTGKPLREALANKLWQDVLENAEQLYRKDFNKEPPEIFKTNKKLKTP